MEIRFQGLITHARVQHSMTGTVHQRAVLYIVPAHPHSALLTVHSGDLVSGTPDFESGDARCFRIRGLLTASNLPAGLPDTTSLKGLPSLREPEISGPNTGASALVKAPVQAIRDFVATSNFSLFNMPDGTMYIRNWFSDTALFSGKVFPAPRTVVLQAIPIGDVTFTIENPPGTTSTLAVVKQATRYVYITNLPIQSGHVPTHWDAMSVFFDQTTNPVSVTNPVTVTTPAFVLGGSDDTVDKCSEPQQLSIECTNSQFP